MLRSLYVRIEQPNRPEARHQVKTYRPSAPSWSLGLLATKFSQAAGRIERLSLSLTAWLPNLTNTWSRLQPWNEATGRDHDKELRSWRTPLGAVSPSALLFVWAAVCASSIHSNRQGRLEGKKECLFSVRQLLGKLAWKQLGFAQQTFRLSLTAPTVAQHYPHTAVVEHLHSSGELNRTFKNTSWPSLSDVGTESF